MTKEIPLTKGYVALVDDDMFDVLNQWRWSAKEAERTTYACRHERRNGRGKIIHMHHIILPPIPGAQIDHINLNGLDNQRCNLRYATQSQNNCNRPKRGQHTSIYKGVYWNLRQQKWIATIQVENVRKSLGGYASEITAAWVYNQAAMRYHREFAYLNDLSNVDPATIVIPEKQPPSSPYPGVVWNKKSERWQTQFTLAGERYYLGMFNTEIDAAAAYVIARTWWSIFAALT